MFHLAGRELPIKPTYATRRWGTTALPLRSPPGVGMASRSAALQVRARQPEQRAADRHALPGVAVYHNRAPSIAEIACDREDGLRVAVVHTERDLPGALTAPGIDHGFLFTGLSIEAALARVARDLDLPAAAPRQPEAESAESAPAAALAEAVLPQGDAPAERAAA